MEDSSGKFKIINTTLLEDINQGHIKELPESDLCIQTSSHIIQYKYIEEDEENKSKFTIKPGVWTIASTGSGTVGLKKLELKIHNL